MPQCIQYSEGKRRVLRTDLHDAMDKECQREQGALFNTGFEQMSKKMFRETAQCTLIFILSRCRKKCFRETTRCTLDFHSYIYLTITGLTISHTAAPSSFNDCICQGITTHQSHKRFICRSVLNSSRQGYCTDSSAAVAAFLLSQVSPQQASRISEPTVAHFMNVSMKMSVTATHN